MADLFLPAGTVLHHEIEVKRSRFLTEVTRVSTPEEARLAIDFRKAEMPDARHHCTAFAVSVLDSSPVLHSSDDGEPSGTAGRPMLEVLRGVPLLDVVAVVTRYFGGTLLGTGGLVRAYSDAVKECLEGVSLLERHIVPVWETLLPHADGGRYLAELAASGFSAEPTYEAEGVRARIATARGAELSDLLARLSSGVARVEQVGRTTVETSWGTVQGGNAVGGDENTA
ncbi:MAG: YigZ family protein [Ancrocorticia sp.]